MATVDRSFVIWIGVSDEPIVWADVMVGTTGSSRSEPIAAGTTAELAATLAGTVGFATE
jgi:hypothetical protein